MSGLWLGLLRTLFATALLSFLVALLFSLKRELK